MKLCTITWAISIFLVFISSVKGAERCCAKNVMVKDANTCADGTKIHPKCPSFRYIFSNEGDGLYKIMRYKIRNDNRGEYLDAYMMKFIILSSNFCLGDYYDEDNKHTRMSVAVICYASRIAYDDLDSKIDESDNRELNYLYYWMLFDDSISFLSCSLLVVAFYVYYLVIQSRQIEDDCLLNVAGSLCLFHAAYLYDFFNSAGVLPDLCITHLYVMNFFNLSGFAWYAMFMYYVWKKCGSTGSLERNQLMKQFRFIGYGIPAILMILANIHAHARNLYINKQLEVECYVHEELLDDVYVHIPKILAIGINCFFWGQSRKYTGTIAIKTTEDEFSHKTFSSLLTLNQRLFFTLGLPWLIYFLLNRALAFIYSTSLTYSWFLADSVINGTGAIVALLLVMSRARVWKCVIYKYENFKWLQKWQPSDEEDSTLTDNSNVDFSKMHPSEV